MTDKEIIDSLVSNFIFIFEKNKDIEFAILLRDSVIPKIENYLKNKYSINQVEYKKYSTMLIKLKYRVIIHVDKLELNELVKKQVLSYEDKLENASKIEKINKILSLLDD